MEEEEYQAPKADKQDYAVAKYLHEHAPKRIGDLHGMEVDCFFAEEAVNCLLDSPWATGKAALFTDRQSVVDFCHELLRKEIFHKASLVKRKPKPTATSRLTDGNDTPGESGNEGKKSKKKSKQSKEEEVSAAKDEESEAKKAKKVKKLKLGMSEDQYFEDGREVYVWIYEPVSWRKFMIGFGILFASVAMCCYPLWPEWLRLGVYYISLAGAAFLGVIISLAILRYVVWSIIYVLTMRKHSFFLLPNLTEDCGFFESFLPLYEYSCNSGEEESKTSKSKKSKDSSTKAAVTEAGGDADKTDSKEKESEGNGNGDDDFEVIEESELS